MKIGTFINHGTMIEITGNQTVNLHIDKGEVRIGKNGSDTPSAETSAEDDMEEEAPTSEEPADAGDADIDACLARFTDEVVKGSGIRVKPREALALMEVMRPQCTQKISWLMFYCVLLRRGWVDANVRAYCRLVATVFNVGLDPHNLSKMLAQHGSDYTKWTEADIRIKAHKALATDFDRRLTEYFVRKRAEVMEGVRQVSPCIPYE